MKKVHFFTGIPLKHLEKTELDQMYWSNVIDSHNLITWSKIISLRNGSDWHLVITRNSLFTDLINVWRSFQRHRDATSKAGKKLYLLQFSILQYWFFKPRIDFVKDRWDHKVNFAFFNSKTIILILALMLALVLVLASSPFSQWNTRSCACAYTCACACVASENKA